MMDDSGYVFSAVAVLLLIPVLVIAINFGEIVNEANLLASMAIGGDVTYKTANNIYSIMEKSAADAGRNTAYNATRKVIDDDKFFANNTALPYIRQNIVNALNNQIISSCRSLERETGREISINNIPINNYTNQTFTLQDVTITQTEPFGFYVNIRGGIPIRVVQKDQVYVGVTPPISSYVSLGGMEDPYVWINSKERTSNLIFKSPYYEDSPFTGVDYHMADVIDRDATSLAQLWNYLNGTNNPSGINYRPYYFPDPYGLSFFDRLENKTNSTSTSPRNVRMSTFIIGNPLEEDFNFRTISSVDHEYFRQVGGTPIQITTTGGLIREMRDPLGAVFFLSPFYKNFFGLQNSY